MNLQKSFSKLCDPAKFYLLLAIISAVYYSYILLTHPKAQEHPDHKVTIDSHTTNGLLVQVVVSIAWVIVLGWVCKMKHGVKVAWFLVFLPIIFVILLTLFVMNMLNDLSDEDIKEIMDEAVDYETTDEDTSDEEGGHLPGHLPGHALGGSLGHEIEGFCSECN